MFNPMEVQATIPPIAPTQLPQDDAPPPPPAMLVKPKENKNRWEASIVRMAQGIYPAEAQAKAAQMQMAKMPTPTGAWGAPK